jgi:hypothetical protein
MARPVPYEEDVYLWSRDQAAALRRLAESRRDLPNDLDLPNVIEEIETVGRSELAAVRSHLARMLEQLMKAASSPAEDPVRHWLAEAVTHRGDARRHFTPGMRKDIDLQALWEDALAETRARLRLYGEEPGPLPEACPFALDELLDRDADVAALLARLRA